MTIDSGVLAEQIYEQAHQLSPENSASQKLRVVKLRGVLKGYDFSPELLADARRAMWQSLETPAS